MLSYVICIMYIINTFTEYTEYLQNHYFESLNKNPGYKTLKLIFSNHPYIYLYCNSVSPFKTVL